MPRACRPRGTTISPPSALRSPPLPDHCCNAESPIHPCTALPSTLIALQDLDKIMLDYTEESVLKCFEHSAGELTTATGLAEIRDFFAGLFGLLTDLSTLAAPVVEVTEAPDKQVYLVWKCPGSGVLEATDTFIFGDDNRILRQNIAWTKGGGSPVKLNYFPLTAKGFGVSLVLEESGIPWESNDFGGAGMKSLKEAFPVWGTKKAETMPFHQLPVLYTDGLEIGQCTAICQYIGYKAKTEGSTDQDYALNNMLMRTADEVYDAMYRNLPSIVDKVHSYDHKTKEAYDKLFAETIPGFLGNLEPLCTTDAGFTTSGCTPGELYLWAFVHQLQMCESATLDHFPKIQAWYQRTLSRPSVEKVLAGDGPIGTMEGAAVAARVALTNVVGAE